MAKATNLEEKVTNTEVEVQEEEKTKMRASSWIIKVKDSPNFCGIGAGGVQFANGRATITSGRMAEWFNEHDGYEVIAQ